MPAVIWKVSSIICALLKVVRSGDASQGNIILIAVTIIHDYHGHCSANTLKNASFIKKKIIKKEKISRAWQDTVDFWSKRKKKKQRSIEC